jgi:hypothetical protein
VVLLPGDGPTILLIDTTTSGLPTVAEHAEAVAAHDGSGSGAALPLIQIDALLRAAGVPLPVHLAAEPPPPAAADLPVPAAPRGPAEAGGAAA